MSRQHPDIVAAIDAYRATLPSSYVVLKRGNRFKLVLVTVWNERDVDYGNHVPWARQLLNNGWELTSRNPVEFVDRINAKRTWASYRYKTTITDMTFKEGVI